MLPHLLGYAFTALSLVLSLALFIAVRRELTARQVRARETWKELEEGLIQLRADMDSLRQGLKHVEDTAGLLVPPPCPRSGLNPQKRSQALRLHRRGESAAQIAAALEIPAKEVELLIKVQRLVLMAAGGEDSRGHT